MGKARKLQSFCHEVEADLRLTGHHIVVADNNDLVPGAVEYLRRRHRDMRIELGSGSEGRFIVKSIPLFVLEAEIDGTEAAP